MAKTPEDMTGRRFGKLLVLAMGGKPEGRNARGVFWQCRCDCGNECVAESRPLRTSRKAHCGCASKVANVWSPERDAALREGWLAGVQARDIYTLVCSIQPERPRPTYNAISCRAFDLGVGRPETFKRTWVDKAQRPARKPRADKGKAKSVTARPSRKPPPVMRPQPSPKPVLLTPAPKPVMAQPVAEPMSYEEAWQNACVLISRKRNLNDVDVAEVARLSGLTRFAAKQKAPEAMGKVRMAIGHVRMARYEGAALS